MNRLQTALAIVLFSTITVLVTYGAAVASSAAVTITNEDPDTIVSCRYLVQPVASGDVMLCKYPAERSCVLEARLKVGGLDTSYCGEVAPIWCRSL